MVPLRKNEGYRYEADLPAFFVCSAKVLLILVDPNEPLMPAVITFSQAKNYAIHLMKEWFD